MQNGDAKRALKAREVGECLGVREQTLAKWRWQRKGPKWFHLGEKGGPVRYWETDVEDYTKARQGGRHEN